MLGGKSIDCVHGAYGRLLLSEDHGCMQSIDWQIEVVVAHKLGRLISCSY